MLLHETPTIAWTAEIEMARALLSAGCYDDVLGIVDPIAIRDGLDALTKFAACQLKAVAHSERGEWVECRDALTLSAPIVDELPPELRGRFFGQRALAHRNLDEIDAALVDYEQARDCAIAVGDDQTLANIRNNLAKVYSDQERVGEALIEVDAAIKIATRLRDGINLGRFLDTKAQALVVGKRYVEALSYSTTAIDLLHDHPAGAEARWTHGLAMIGAGASYLEKPKSIEQFRDIHDAAKLIQVELGVELLEVALKRAEGHVLGAAKLLHVSHSLIIKLIKKHGLERVPQRRRNKSLIAK